MTEPTFKQAYGTLQRHAEALRTQREPNIDDLLTIVTESVDAYKVCKKRIDAVEKALEQALGSTGVDAAPVAEVAGSTVRPPSSAGGGVADDDDIPF